MRESLVLKIIRHGNGRRYFEVVKDKIRIAGSPESARES